MSFSDEVGGCIKELGRQAHIRGTEVEHFIPLDIQHVTVGGIAAETDIGAPFAKVNRTAINHSQ